MTITIEAHCEICLPQAPEELTEVAKMEKIDGEWVVTYEDGVEDTFGNEWEVVRVEGK